MDNDFIIIGAGPAGCAAAYHLARGGRRVLLVERARFPRLKVCGEFVSPAATGILQGLISAEELLGAGGRRVEEFVLELGSRKRVWRMPRPAWALSRATLDTLLLKGARQAGAAVREGESVQSVVYDLGGVRVILQNGETLHGSCLIHADGSGRHDPAGAVPSARDVVGYKCHLRLPPGIVRGVSMRACSGAYVGMIGVENGLATCAFSARKNVTAKHKGDGDAMLRALWPQYNAAWRTTPWLACGVARSPYMRPGHPRSLRIGNAAAAVDPIGGEGIGLALWSGARVAALLNSELAPHSPPDHLAIGRAERFLAREYSARLRTRRYACGFAAELFMRPALVSLVWPLLSLSSLTIGSWYRLTGKPA